MIKVKLWHGVYNGGWVWFDREQTKRLSCGGFREDYKYSYLNDGKPDRDRTVWWCFFGFCGKIHLQTWPWQKDPRT